MTYEVDTILSSKDISDLFDRPQQGTRAHSTQSCAIESIWDPKIDRALIKLWELLNNDNQIIGIRDYAYQFHNLDPLLNS